MAIEQTPGVFFVGPQGRAVNVNASGQLEATDGGGALKAYSVSDNGRAIGVDSAGRLGVIISAPLSIDPNTVASGSFDLVGLRQMDFRLIESLTFDSFDNPNPGAKYMFILEQWDAGSFTVTWPANVKWRGAAAPILSTASGSIDVVTMVYRDRDATFLADVGLDFS